MEASRESSRTPRRLPPCSDVSVLQKTRMSHFWDTHRTAQKAQKAYPDTPCCQVTPVRERAVEIRGCHDKYPIPWATVIANETTTFDIVSPEQLGIMT